MEPKPPGDRVVRERSVVDVLDEVIGRGIVIQRPDEDVRSRPPPYSSDRRRRK